MDAGDDELTVWSSIASIPSWCGPSSPISSSFPVASVRIVVPWLGGRFRQQVVYQDGADHRRRSPARPDRPVRIQNSVDESMVTTRRHGMKAWMRTAARKRRHPAGSRGARLVRHRRLCRQRTARRRHRRRCRARSVSLGQRSRSTPGASTPTPRRRVRTALSARPISVVRRSAGRRDRPQMRTRRLQMRELNLLDRANMSGPAANRSMPISSATFAKSPQISIGTRPSQPECRPRHERRVAGRGRAPGQHRVLAHGSRRQGRALCSSARPIWGRERAPYSARSWPKSWR